MVHLTTEAPDHLSVTPAPSLTPKQRDVCALVAKGRTTKEIAIELGIGARTVEGHRDAIYEKFGVRNAVELTRKVLGAA